MNLKLTKIRQGKGITVIVINGFLSESNKDLTDWFSIVDNTYKDATVMHLDWPASNIKKHLVNFAASKLVTTALTAAIPIVGWLSAAKTTVDLTAITREWRKSISNTVGAGEFLAKYIDSNAGKYVIMGHSLGARVTYHTLCKLKRVERVNDVYLLGGAVSNEGDWDRLGRNNHNLRLVNMYSHNDSVLKYLYSTGTAFSNDPIGLNKIISSSKNQIRNLDSSHLVDGHMDYKKGELGVYMSSIIRA